MKSSQRTIPMTDTQTALEHGQHLYEQFWIRNDGDVKPFSEQSEAIRNMWVEIARSSLSALQSRTEQEPARHLPTRDEIRSEIRGAIGEFVIGDGSAALAAEAVLALLHEKEPHEPLGWAYRFLGSPSGEWCKWKLVEKREDLVHDPRNFYGFQIEPLYTAPPDQSARIADDDESVNSQIAQELINWLVDHEGFDRGEELHIADVKPLLDDVISHYDVEITSKNARIAELEDEIAALHNKLKER